MYIRIMCYRVSKKNVSWDRGTFFRDTRYFDKIPLAKILSCCEGPKYTSLSWKPRFRLWDVEEAASMIITTCENGKQSNLWVRKENIVHNNRHLQKRKWNTISANGNHIRWKWIQGLQMQLSDKKLYCSLSNEWQAHISSLWRELSLLNTRDLNIVFVKERRYLVFRRTEAISVELKHAWRWRWRWRRRTTTDS